MSDEEGVSRVRHESLLAQMSPERLIAHHLEGINAALTALSDDVHYIREAIEEERGA